MIISLLFQNPTLYFMAAVSIIMALTLHEYAHAQAADLLGDLTPRRAGRLTVNPTAHLDPFGAFFILVLGFGWGKPVPFNIMNLKDKRWGPAIIGAAGPMANLISALVIGMVLRFVDINNAGLKNFFVYFVIINLFLFVFNLIPISPLDGSHILDAILNKQIGGYRAMIGGGFLSIMFAIFFMMYIGIPFIAAPLFQLITGFSIRI